MDSIPVARQAKIFSLGVTLGSRGYRFVIDRRINAVHLKKYSFSGAMRENARRIQDLTRSGSESRQSEPSRLRAHRWTRILSLAIPGPALAIGLLALMAAGSTDRFPGSFSASSGSPIYASCELCRRSRGLVFALQAAGFLFFEMLAAEYFTLRAYLKNWRISRGRLSQHQRFHWEAGSEF